GVYGYDQTTHKTTGPDRTTFTGKEDFAAVVNWSSLPPNITVDARWYDTFGTVVGRAGPATPADLKDQTTIPVAAPAPFERNLPGRYIFVVERLDNGVPVEVLARRLVLVEG